eukprot:TRINITY_DN38431_c0_g1_i1.p1 TRINITY_DN38431_c0_g1~~TRINITY_DN38431_c0_g1_i1.p1  ORF type:complete len:512 (-),score=97.87 TRINITY_DN38431_c0_g1_i1:187-1722(-)
MGSGASRASFVSELQAASVSELESALKGLDASQRRKLEQALQESDRERVVFACSQDRPPLPVPLLGSVVTDLISSGTYFTAACCADGTLWMLTDGCESPVEWKLLSRKAGHLSNLSVHDSVVLGLTEDNSCVGFPTHTTEPDIWASLGAASEVVDSLDGVDELSEMEPLELSLFKGHSLKEIVGHSPEDWLLGLTVDGKVWAFGPAVPDSVCQVDLPAPCVKMSANKHGLALLQDGRVFMLRATTAQYRAAPAEISESGIQAVHVVELDGLGVTDVAVGLRHSVAVTKAGKLFTWGTCNLYGSSPFGNDNYLGQLWRATADGDEDTGCEYGPVPEQAQLPSDFAGMEVSSASSSPTGEIFVKFTDGSVLRLALGADFKAKPGLWGADVTVHPQRYTFMACVEVKHESLHALASTELAAFAEGFAQAQQKLKKAQEAHAAGDTDAKVAGLLDDVRDSFSWRGATMARMSYWLLSLQNLAAFHGDGRDLIVEWSSFQEEFDELDSKLEDKSEE